MMARSGGRPGQRDAAALRFLLLLLGGWVLLRAMILWSPAAPVTPDTGRPPWAPPAPFAAPPRDFSMAVPVGAWPDQAPVRSKAGPASLAMAAAPPIDPAMATAPVGGGFDADRHSLRFALMARLFPGSQAAAAPRGSSWLAKPAVSAAAPAAGQPFWMQRSLSGWSLSGWIYLREGSGGAPGGIATASQLGGSQAGARLAYGLDDVGQLRAYGRATVAIERPKQRELAFGLAFAPDRRWPVDVAVEHRFAVGKEGRTALAAMIAGGVSEVELPAGFRLNAYAQAGVVGMRQRDGFADGAVVIDHRIGRDEQAPFRLGALAAGAAQPGAARVDVGPRLTLKLPDVGQGSRIALDWRQRVAGDARPESGVALTLATDF